jgi:O-antigen/teichoic acid export membrane protein
MAGIEGTGRQLVRNTVFTGLGRVVSLIVGFVLSPYILNNLGDRAFGYWVLAFGFGHHLSILLGFGASHGLIYRLAKARTENDYEGVYRSLGAYILIALGSTALTLVALLLSIPLVTRFFDLKLELLWSGGEDFGVELILCAAVATLLRPITLAWDLILQGCERFDEAGKLAVLRALGWGIIVVTLLSNNYGARGLLLGEAILLVTLAIPGTFMAWRALPGEKKGVLWPTREELSSQLRYGFGIYVSLVTDLLNSHSDKLVLGGQLSAVHVKAYELGQKITLPGRLALVMLGQVVVPSVPGVLREHGEEGLRRLHRVGQKAMLLASSLFVAFLIATAPGFLKSWLGPAAVDPQTIMALRLLALATFFSILTELSIQLARGLGKLKTEIKATLIFSVIGFLLRILLLSLWGLPGLLVGTIVTSLLTSVYLLKAFSTVLGYEILEHLRQTALKPFLCALCGAITVTLIHPQLPTPALPQYLGSRTPHLFALGCDAFVFLSFAGLSGWLLGVIDEDLKSIIVQLKSLLRRMFAGSQSD